jgi:peptidoglycan/LPS O-acetylase OafA/YrhL
MRDRSIAARIAATGGHASGFDYMRLCLALSIVCLHSSITSYGRFADQAMFDTPFKPLLRLILPAFFALSGFLVAGSLERSKTLGMFVGLRVIRIYPALAVEVLISAFIIGPLVTSATLTTYFTDPEFSYYLRNVFGDIHFLLPGVFEHNPLPLIVNGQLWTIPFELYCYAVLAGITVLGLKKYRMLGPAFVVLIIVAYVFVTLSRHHGKFVTYAGALNGALLIATFLAAVSIYLYRDVLPWTPAAGMISGVLALISLDFQPYSDFFAPFPVAYFTVYLGLMNPSRRALMGADYSYGIFLYGFAVQQTVVHFVPAAHFWLVNMLITVPAVVLVAAASWHFVERPAQRLKTVLKRGEARFLDWRSRGRKAAVAD